MAIITFGSLIISMSGKHDNYVHYYRRGTHCARIYVVPRNPDTQSQRIVRRSFAAAVKSWQGMPVYKRDTFNKKARFLNMSGYNLFISLYMKAGMRSAASASAAPPTLNHTGTSPFPLRSPSVSKPYIKASGAFAFAGPLKTCPGTSSYHL